MNRDLIDRFFDGKCTPKEAALFLNWLQSQDSDSELSAFLEEHWENMNDDFEDKPEILSKIHQLIDHKKIHGIKSISNISFFIKAAASLSILIISAITIFWLNTHHSEAIFPTEPKLSMVKKSTESGQKLTVVLPDSSVVILNSGSSIVYPQRFTDTIRKVDLKGEAFFDIKKDTLPFVVFAGDLQTRVLGTSFNIKSLENEKMIEVALLSGSVQIAGLNDNGNQVLLTPGDLMIYDQDLERFNKQKWDYKKIFGWKEGILYFENNTLDEIKLRLEQWYGVSIEINEDKNKDRHFTGSFQNASLKNVLESLSFTFGFRYKLHDQNVSILF